MNKIPDNFFDIGYLDTMAYGSSVIHRLDPRAKLITTVVFIAVVISFNKYAVFALVPFCLYPVALAAVSGVSSRYLFRKVLLVLPVAAMIALGNPLFDRQVVAHIGSFGITGGWISFFSILLRLVITVAAVLVLIATTGFNAVCLGLSKLGVPRPFVVQLLLLYRYIFVLMEEAGRMVRACASRSFDSRAMRVRTFGSLIGILLLRTIDRAGRVYLAMCCRGFDGNIRILRTMKTGTREVLFAVSWILLFIVFRVYNIPALLGSVITGVK
jgi:cobalt/nickel transport system permease protein